MVGYPVWILSQMAQSTIYPELRDITPFSEDIIQRGSEDCCSVRYYSPRFMLIVVLGFLAAMVVTAWSVRGLTLLLGRSKTSPVNRLDDIAQDEILPLNELHPDPETPRRSSEITLDLNTITESLPAPSHVADPSRIRGPGIDLPASREGFSANLLNEYQHPRPPTSTQKLAAFITTYLDLITWGLVWIIGIGVYIGTGYSMPAQLPLNVLTFFLAMRIPPRVRRFIHPIFPCAAFTILGIFILAAIKGESLNDGKLLPIIQSDTRSQRVSNSDAVYSICIRSQRESSSSGSWRFTGDCS